MKKKTKFLSVLIKEQLKTLTPLVSSPDIDTLWKCGTYRSWSSNSSISAPASGAPTTEGS